MGPIRYTCTRAHVHTRVHLDFTVPYLRYTERICTQRVRFLRVHNFNADRTYVSQIKYLLQYACVLQYAHRTRVALNRSLQPILRDRFKYYIINRLSIQYK